MSQFPLLVLLVISMTALRSSAKLVANAVSNNTFDYVIVGCGISGLVVAARLTEDSSVSVLCLEAGALDSYEDLIQIPVYIGLQPPLFYQWGITTVPQTQLDGATRAIPMGKGVGGGSLINGMIWNRGNEDDFNVWSQIGNSGWSWGDLLPYFQKSETYTPQYYPDQAVQPVQFDASYHGFNGSAQVSYPKYFWNQSNYWFDALQELGVPKSFDPNEGLSAGGYFLPLSIHPTNQTRSDARRTYYDPFSWRSNYNIVTNSQATRIMFGAVQGSDLTSATAVEYAVGPNAPRQTVYARQEIILAAGAIHTPQILELSGIGSAGLLQSYGIPTVEDLPGVGNNLQDHTLIHLQYPYQNQSLMTPESLMTNSTFNMISSQEYLSSRTGPWTSKPSTAVAFPSLPQITNQTYNMILSAKTGDRQYPLTYEKTLRAGFELQFSSIISRLLSNDTPAYEILNDNSGGLDLCLMRPLSRGTSHISSPDAFQQPSVDPRWLVNPFDFDVMIAAMEFNQVILDTAPIQQLMPSYQAIPQNAIQDQLADILRRGVGTEYHYSGTAAMMPRELGGVVDSNLVVYGTSNLRVVDTSMFPIIPGAHLQAVVYAVAEKAADMIRGLNMPQAV